MTASAIAAWGFFLSAGLATWLLKSVGRGGVLRQPHPKTRPRVTLATNAAPDRSWKAFDLGEAFLIGLNARQNFLPGGWAAERKNAHLVPHQKLPTAAHYD